MNLLPTIDGGGIDPARSAAERSAPERSAPVSDAGRAQLVRRHVRGLETWGVRRMRRVIVPRDAELTDPVPATAVGGEEARNPSTSVREHLAVCAAEVAACTRCSLHATRTRTAFGVGDAHARLLLVGEAPGREEDLQGEPFVGPAGQLLDRVIAALGLQRGQVYLANVLKCRPPDNRDPRPDEVQACAGYLARQIELVAPSMIVALGRSAAQALLGTTQSLDTLRGARHEYRGISVVVTYHPAYLMRNPDEKKKTWQDLQVVIQELGLPGPTR